MTRKATAQIKFYVFSIRYVIVVSSIKIQRPAESDPRRECWDRAARCIWRIIIVLFTFTAGTLVAKWGMDNSIAAVFAADRMPEIIKEIVEYLKKL